jgi:excisionase family DNA binding protein
VSSAVECPVSPTAFTRPEFPRDRLVTVDDVAKLTHVSINTVRWWIQHKVSPQPARIGRQFRWNPAVIDPWLSERGV